jgi:indole-3-glycerol phosphate synthase
VFGELVINKELPDKMELDEAIIMLKALSLGINNRNLYKPSIKDMTYINKMVRVIQMLPIPEKINSEA